MGKGITVEVTNSKAVQLDLKKYGKGVEKKLAKAIDIAALNIESKAKVRVPKDSSDLATSIGKRNTKTGAVVATNVEYAAYVEHNKPIGTGPHGGPRPYLFNSFKEEVKALKMRIKRLTKST